jgi:beta-galactosidase
VTVTHDALPLWVHDGVACNASLDGCTAKGWVDRARIVPEIAKYAGFVAREFGADVDEWATLNEPFTAVTLAGYLTPTATRVNPPGVFLKADAAKTVTLAMIEAHARMYDAIKSADGVDADGDGVAASVGLVYAVTAVAPNVDNAADRNAAADARYFMNDMFLRAVAQGIVDEKWDGNGVARSDLRGRLDWLGVNYYTRIKAQATRLGIFNPLRFVSPKLTFNLLNTQPDMNYPQGLHEVLVDMAKYGVPMIVSETGIDQADDASVGPTWVVRTLQGVRRALDEGLDVRGYYAWSLMDNYEWNHGMSQRFGLYAVDPLDPKKARVARPSVAVYGRIGAERRIADDLAAAYGQ